VPATAPPRIVVPPAPATPSPPAGERLPVYPDLPPEVKRQLPALAVNGSVYAPVAASRLVIVNGQVLREGDSVTEGLVVERIGLKSSQLSWRGTRFELRH
jgi:general secretion pathway protein B